jgi:hypothetical protein
MDDFRRTSRVKKFQEMLCMLFCKQEHQEQEKSTINNGEYLLPGVVIGIRTPSIHLKLLR